MKILAIFNAKGGVGKTTTAVNLAACFAAAGQRIVVFDLDAQGNATTSLGRKQALEVGSYDVITNKASVTDALVDTFFDSIRLVGATKNLATIDVDLALGVLDRPTVRKVIEPIAAETDILIMDCAPTFGTMTINALISADAVLIPSQPTPYAHDGLLRTWTILSRIRSEINPGLMILGILPTFCSADGPDTVDNASEREILSTMKAEFGNTVHPNGIPLDSRHCLDAAAFGVPAVVYSPESPAAQAYIRLSQDLMNEDGSFNRLGNLPGSPGNRSETITGHLKKWRSLAEAEGLLKDKVNLPGIDLNAIQSAAQPIADADPDGTVTASRVSRYVMTTGLCLLSALSGFFLGWFAQ